MLYPWHIRKVSTDLLVSWLRATSLHTCLRSRLQVFAMVSTNTVQLDLSPVFHSVISGIAVTLFARAVATIMRKRNTAGKLNLPLIIPSILIFMFATVASFMLFVCHTTCWRHCSFQNVVGLWIHMYTTFVVNADDPEAYLDLIRSPPKMIIQTGQVGAIILADALMVWVLSIRLLAEGLNNLHI